jgi:DNA invertase Pin-like site-specific DNA recombinase
VSRFARNTVDSLTTVRKLKDEGIEIYFEKKDFDTANLSRKSKIKQNTPRYAAILGNIKGHF